MSMNREASLGELLPSRPRVKIIDIGANPIDGTPPYRPLLKTGQADVLGFEPNPDALARLIREKGPHETYLPDAIGDGAQHTLHVCVSPGMTSLLPPDERVLARFHGFSRWGTVLEKLPVATRRLDDVPEAAGVDYIKIDIQGAELMVFRHASTLLSQCVLIHTEVEFLPLYRDQPLFSDVDQYLRQHGFILHRFAPLVSRVVQPLLVNNDPYAGLSQLVWADAVFIKDFTRPERLDDAQLLTLALILHDCYESLDVVLALLNEHDCRCGTSYGKQYLAQISGAPKASTAG